jgi:hypothetical protein
MIRTDVSELEQKEVQSNCHVSQGETLLSSMNRGLLGLWASGQFTKTLVVQLQKR